MDSFQDDLTFLEILYLKSTPVHAIIGFVFLNQCKGVIMDYNTNNPNDYGYGQPNPDYSHQQRYGADGAGFAHAAMIMGMIALLTCRITLFPTILAAIAAILAILSKGYHKKMTKKARYTVAIAVIAIVLNVAWSIYSINTLLRDQQFLNQFEQMYEQIYGVPFDSSFDPEGGEML